MLKNKKIALLGNGFMATAIVTGLLNKKVAEKQNLFFVNGKYPEAAISSAKQLGINYGEPEALQNVDIIILAFKPQDFSQAVSMYRPYINKGTLIISIMAGIEIETIQAAFSEEIAVIRVMPNLALAAAKSASAYALGQYVNENDLSLFEEIFSSLGIIKRVDEPLLSQVTALSGSGPAYFYFLAECMIEAAVSAGLDKNTAFELCRQTMLGTAALWEKEETLPLEMRQRITSEKGTTDTAIKSMQKHDLYKAVDFAMNAAANRADEIARELKEGI